METISQWFLDSLDKASDVHEGVALIQEIADTVGMPRLAVIRNIDDDEPPVAQGKPLAVLMGWPEPWLQNFMKEDLKRYEPNTNYCRFEHRPFIWRTNETGTMWKNQLLSGMQLRAMRALREHVGSGITSPVYRTCGRIGHVTWINSSPGFDVDDAFARYGRDLFLIAHHFIEALDRWVKGEEESLVADPLTAREKECLRWVALGKTDQEVSDIIFRSPATTRFHVKNAIRKLGASNRAHAVSIAYQRGLLGPQH